MADCAASDGEGRRIATVSANGGGGYITTGRGTQGTTGFAVGYGASPEAAERNCRA
jgi:hypothetical protein